MGLREETAKQKRVIKKQQDELNTLNKMLQTFREKNEAQANMMQEQLQELQKLTDKADDLEEEVRVLQMEKRNLEAALKDEIARRKDAEFALEKTREQLRRKTEEFNELDGNYTIAQETIRTLDRDLKIAKSNLQATEEEAMREKQAFNRQLDILTKTNKDLRAELERVETTLTAKIAELTSNLLAATTENADLRDSVGKLKQEVIDTKRAWAENVAQVRKECADEIERRGQEIYDAFAGEREMHVRRLKIQNYEIRKRDQYCTAAQDLNPLPLPEFTEDIGEGEGSEPKHAFCYACRKQVVLREEQKKRLSDIVEAGQKNVGRSPKKPGALSPIQHTPASSRRSSPNKKPRVMK